MLRGLRNPAKAAQTVAYLKKTPIDLHEVVQIIAELSKRPAKSWPEPTLRWCANQLAHTTDPLVRHFLQTKLPPQSAEVANAHILSLINTKSHEMALYLRQKSSDLTDSVLIANFLAKNGVLPRNFSAGQWFSAFNLAVSEFNYEKSVKIWDKRTKFLSTPVSQPVLEQFIQILGAHRDKLRLKNVLSGVNYDLPKSDAVLSAIVRCLPSVPEVLRIFCEPNTEIVVTNLSDWAEISDLLVSDLTYLTNLPAGLPCSVGNLILNGVYRNYTSQMVFHVYRKLLVDRMPADNLTAQILANAAYRLGNSKLVINGIYTNFRHLNLPRKFYETMLIILLTGSQFSSAKYALAEMRRRQIRIRPHIQRMIYNQFAKNSENFRDITHPQFASRYLEFPAESAIAEAGSPAAQAQARANLDVYLHGLHPESDFAVSLPEILAFEARRAAKFTKYGINNGD